MALKQVSTNIEREFKKHAGRNTLIKSMAETLNRDDLFKFMATGVITCAVLSICHHLLQKTLRGQYN